MSLFNKKNKNDIPEDFYIPERMDLDDENFKKLLLLCRKLPKKKRDIFMNSFQILTEDGNKITLRDYISDEELTKL